MSIMLTFAFGLIIGTTVTWWPCADLDDIMGHGGRNIDRLCEAVPCFGELPLT